jgi:hypothetical protein
MDQNLDTNIGTTFDRRNPDGKWVTWAIWSGTSLVAVLVAVLVAGMDPSLLLGWAAGIIIAAMFMVFRR